MEGITREQIIRSSILDDIEVSYIVDEYIKLVRTKFSQYKYYLSAQATVDWFGRSIRGPDKIFQYMRHEALVSYDHLISTFGSAKACEPFETKPSHFKTKTFSSENVDDLVPDDVKGLVSLRVYSDRDFERNMAELGLSSLIKRAPLPTCPNFSDDDDEGAAGTDDVQPSTRVIDAINRDMDMESDDSNLSVEGLGRHGFFHRSNFLIAYTPLRYVEVLGQLRGYPEKIKNGIQTRDDTSGNHWDRPIRIRLSYRKRISDNQVEFALILYEGGHGTPAEGPSNLRRNLMLEFNEISNVTSASGRAAGEDDDDTPLELGTNDPIPTEIFHAVIASEGIDRTRIVNEIENLNVDSSALNVEIFSETSEVGQNQRATNNTTTTIPNTTSDVTRYTETEYPPNSEGAVGPAAPCATPTHHAATSNSLLDSMEGIRRLESPIAQHRSPTAMDTSMEYETVIGMVTTPTSDSIAEALEQAALTIVPMRTPTKSMPETPATPKRKPRNLSSLKRCNLTPTAPPPKRSAARNLRL